MDGLGWMDWDGWIGMDGWMDGWMCVMSEQRITYSSLGIVGAEVVARAKRGSRMVAAGAVEVVGGVSIDRGGDTSSPRLETTRSQIISNRSCSL
jgi:hypothetical protein